MGTKELDKKLIQDLSKNIDVKWDIFNLILETLNKCDFGTKEYNLLKELYDKAYKTIMED